MNKIRKGDLVRVIAGRSKGQQGKVIDITKNGRVIVEGVNLVTKFVKKGWLGKGQAGQMMKKEASIHASNVVVICPECSKPTRVEIEVTKDGKKLRKCKKCGKYIDLAVKAKSKDKDKKQEDNDKSKI